MTELDSSRVPVAVARGTRYVAAMMRWLGPCILASWASLGCGQSRLLDSPTSQVTRVRLAPESFRGTVPCSRGSAGALQMYVAHFEEVSESPLRPDAGLRRVNSDPAPCDRAVVIDAAPGVAYVADLYGFDRVVTELVPDLAQARWQASCGRGIGASGKDAGLDGPTRAVYGAVVPMIGCTSFSGEGSGSTNLIVDQSGALGDLRCGTGQGQVSRFEAVLDSTRVSAACGALLAFELPAAKRMYSIELTAYESSGTAMPAPGGGTGDELDASLPDATADAADAAAPLDAGSPPASGQGSDGGVSDAGLALGVARWHSQCEGTTSPGVSSIASCDPLQAIP
jgi:hypothetical protein